jgi:hypothetical protein
MCPSTDAIEMLLFEAPAEAIAGFLRSARYGLAYRACQRSALRRHRHAGRARSESAEVASHGQAIADMDL